MLALDPVHDLLLPLVLLYLHLLLLEHIIHQLLAHVLPLNLYDRYVRSVWEKRWPLSQWFKPERGYLVLVLQSANLLLGLRVVGFYILLVLLDPLLVYVQLFLLFVVGILNKVRAPDWLLLVLFPLLL